MRSHKRYTTQTFTRRVDHEGGAHVGPKALKEPAVCSKCGAVYCGRRWTVGRLARAKHQMQQEETVTICPACKQTAEGIVGGYVLIDGQFVTQHHRDIVDLIKNEERRAMEDNPLSRIMSRSDDGSSVRIETTTEHLAQRLGRALEKAFAGSVNYDFSHENKMARVWWHRD